MEKEQIKKIKDFNALIMNKKIDRKSMYIREYTIFKKNSQIHILLKYSNAFKNIYSYSISIKKDSSIFVNLKNEKIFFNKDVQPNEILNILECKLKDFIKLPKTFKYKQNFNSYHFNKFMLYFLKNFNKPSIKRISLKFPNEYGYNQFLMCSDKGNIVIKEKSNLYIYQIIIDNKAVEKLKTGNPILLLNEVKNEGL